MTRLDWKIPAIALGLFILVFPTIREETEKADVQIKIVKARWAALQDLMEHREQYQHWQKEIAEKGESLWGSTEIGDFVAELQSVSGAAGVPLLYLRPRAQEGAGEIAAMDAEIGIEGNMSALGKFLYEVLRLPGLMTIEKLVLSEADRAQGTLSAQLLISRKFPASKKGTQIKNGEPA